MQKLTREPFHLILETSNNPDVISGPKTTLAIYRKGLYRTLAFPVNRVEITPTALILSFTVG
ncbi:MAG: hypothetical protein JJP05_04210 [cyanobacterium endosymbiont of Rhopalodia gibba]|jgi:hypothetical protein